MRIKKQNHTDSCGAACLLVAALELGINGTPNDIQNLWFGTKLDLNMTSETEIYHHTTNGKASGYSMPSALATAAKELGFNVTLYLDGAILPTFLKWKYPNEESNCTNAGIDVIYAKPGPVDEHSRLLCVVAVGGLGLHYVLHRPNGSYMDPAYGTNHTGSLWGMGQLGILRYIDTGIYVHITVKNTIFMV